MKIQKYITVLALSFSALCGTLLADSSAEHSHAKKQAGPNGGRLITEVTPHAEFFFTADRFAQITFVNDAGEAIAPAEQVVSLMGGSRSNPVQLSFERVNDTLRSVEALPEQDSMPIILSIKSAPEAKTVREKFYLNLSNCGGCDYQEYACVCGH